MTANEITLALLGFLGWFWAIAQYFLNRKHQRRDRLIEMRYKVYAAFMDRVDEAQRGMKADMTELIGVFPAFMAIAIRGDANAIDNALVEFNEKLAVWLKKATEPLLTINQETNKMRLVCSKQMQPMVDEYKRLADDYCGEYQLVLNAMSNTTDIGISAKALENLGHSERQKTLSELWPLMVNQMRQELGTAKE